MSGTVNITRALWDDPTFKDGEMTQREAWIWLIAEASWKGRAKRIGSIEVSLQRGQLAASTRFMAAAWMWSEPRVRRYLEMLENRRMIERVTDAGVTVITICNYEKYQTKGRVADATSTQQPTQDRRTTDANENQGERKILDDDGGDAREPTHAHTHEAPPPPAPRPEDRTFRESMLDAMGCDRSGLIGPSGRMIGGQADMLVAAGWIRDLGLTGEQIIVVIGETMARKRDPGPPSTFKFFTKAMQRFAADLEDAARPIQQLPNRQIYPQQNQAAGGRNARAERAAFSHAIDQLAADLSAGTVKLDTSRSDPFAKRSR